MMTVAMAVMKWAACRPVQTLSFSVPVGAVFQQTGLVMVTTTVVILVMRTQPVEVDLHVRMSVSL